MQLGVLVTAAACLLLSWAAAAYDTVATDCSTVMLYETSGWYAVNCSNTTQARSAKILVSPIAATGAPFSITIELFSAFQSIDVVPDSCTVGCVVDIFLTGNGVTPLDLRSASISAQESTTGGFLVNFSVSFNTSVPPLLPTSPALINVMKLPTDLLLLKVDSRTTVVISSTLLQVTTGSNSPLGKVELRLHGATIANSTVSFYSAGREAVAWLDAPPPGGLAVVVSQRAILVLDGWDSGTFSLVSIGTSGPSTWNRIVVDNTTVDIKRGSIVLSQESSNVTVTLRLGASVLLSDSGAFWKDRSAHLSSSNLAVSFTLGATLLLDRSSFLFDLQSALVSGVNMWLGGSSRVTLKNRSAVVKMSGALSSVDAVLILAMQSTVALQSAFLLFALGSLNLRAITVRFTSNSAAMLDDSIMMASSIGDLQLHTVLFTFDGISSAYLNQRRKSSYWMGSAFSLSMTNDSHHSDVSLSLSDTSWMQLDDESSCFAFLNGSFVLDRFGLSLQGSPTVAMNSGAFLRIVNATYGVQVNSFSVSCLGNPQETGFAISLSDLSAILLISGGSYAVVRDFVSRMEFGTITATLSSAVVLSGGNNTAIYTQQSSRVALTNVSFVTTAASNFFCGWNVTSAHRNVSIVVRRCTIYLSDHSNFWIDHFGVTENVTVVIEASTILFEYLSSWFGSGSSTFRGVASHFFNDTVVNVYNGAAWINTYEGSLQQVALTIHSGVTMELSNTSALVNVFSGGSIADCRILVNTTDGAANATIVVRSTAALVNVVGVADSVALQLAGPLTKVALGDLAFLLTSPGGVISNALVEVSYMAVLYFGPGGGVISSPCPADFTLSVIEGGRLFFIMNPFPIPWVVGSINCTRCLVHMRNSLFVVMTLLPLNAVKIPLMVPPVTGAPLLVQTCNTSKTLDSGGEALSLTASDFTDVGKRVVWEDACLTPAPDISTAAPLRPPRNSSGRNVEIRAVRIDKPAAISGLIGGGLSGPGAGAAAVRASLAASLLDCESLSLDDQFDGNYLSIGFGESQGHFVRGTVVGSLVILLAGNCFWCALALAVYRCSDHTHDSRTHAPSSFWDACAEVALPGWAVVPYGVVAQPLLGASLTLLVAPTDGGGSDTALGVVGIILSLAAIVAITDRVTLHFAAVMESHHDNKPLPLLLEQSVDDTTLWRVLTTVITRRMGGEHGEWVDKKGMEGSRFVQRYGPLFEVYRIHRQWSIVVEVLVGSVACAAVQSVSYLGLAYCKGSLIALGVVQVVLFLYMAIFRPHATVIEFSFTLALSFIGALFAVLVFVPTCDACQDAAATVAQVQVYGSFGQIAVALFAIIGKAVFVGRRSLYGLSAVFRYLWVRLRGGVSSIPINAFGMHLMAATQRGTTKRTWVSAAHHRAPFEESMDEIILEASLTRRRHSSGAFGNGDHEESQRLAEIVTWICERQRHARN